VSDYYAQRGSAVDTDDIFLTASTSEAYSLLFKLLFDPADEVLAPLPGYPLIEWLARAEGIRTRSWTSFYDGQWQPDLEGLEASVRQRTRGLALVHPNNPTGAYLKDREWGGLSQVCRRHDLSVICDEVFWDYRLAGDEQLFDPLAENEVPLCVLNGLSKSAGLPQMKLGWIVLRGPSDFRSQAAERLEFLADHYLSASAPVQWAAAELIEAGKSVRQQIQQRIQGNRDVLESLLENSPARALASEGGWHAVIELPRIRSSEEMALLLLDQDDVVVHPGDFYGFSEGCQAVISLLPHPSDFATGVGRMRDRVAVL
jgi:hypothetical protein